VDVLE